MLSSTPFQAVTVAVAVTVTVSRSVSVTVIVKIWLGAIGVMINWPADVEVGAGGAGGGAKAFVGAGGAAIVFEDGGAGAGAGSTDEVGMGIRRVVLGSGGGMIGGFEAEGRGAGMGILEGARSDVDERRVTTGGRARELEGSGIPAVDDEGRGCWAWGGADTVGIADVVRTDCAGGRMLAAAEEGGGMVVYCVNVIVTMRGGEVVVGTCERSVVWTELLATEERRELETTAAVDEGLGWKKLKPGREEARGTVGLIPVEGRGRPSDVPGIADELEGGGIA